MGDELHPSIDEPAQCAAGTFGMPLSVLMAHLRTSGRSQLSSTRCWSKKILQRPSLYPRLSPQTIRFNFPKRSQIDFRAPLESSDCRPFLPKTVIQRGKISSLRHSIKLCVISCTSRKPAETATDFGLPATLVCRF